MKYSELMLEKNISQKPAIELLKKLGYVFLSPEEAKAQRYGSYNVILKDILRDWLKRNNHYEYNGKVFNFSNFNIEKAIVDIDENLSDGLVRTSEKIYNSLMLGKSFVEEVEGKLLSFGIDFVDWKDFSNNVFHVTEEFFVESADQEHNAKPDLVLFVNGIPFCVIECKSSVEDVFQGVEQSIRNQSSNFIPQLYKFAQLIISTNKNEVRYGTCGTPKKFYATWNYQRDEKEFIESKVESLELGRKATSQDYVLTAILSPERLLEITKYFVLFDANVKKVCRYQQYYAVKEMIKTIEKADALGNRNGGVIWHTQGSGKSLTMVMISNYILNQINPGNSKVIVVTDRKELDKQIARTFNNTKLKATRATSGRHLTELIENGNADVVTCIINKFNAVENSSKRNLSRDVFVLVDEAHRSNYKELATKMRVVFPNACYLGFTGTPLLKNEKTANTFSGNMIHKYTIKDAVQDKMIVPLLYEGRFVEQHVDEANIDLWFKKTCAKLNERQKDDLSRKWSSLKKLNSTNKRIERIALDIDEHFTENFLNTGFKAMIATNFKADAVKYYNAFKNFSDLNVEVCISAPDQREGHDEVDDESNVLEVLKFWNNKMKEYGNPEEYEDSIKNKFCDGDIDILIVCSKFLTGFDAPICQVLYIDKELKEHGLLQAIARTNRIAEGKDFGLIVDYRGLIDNLDNALGMYCGAGFENFDKDDIQGVLTDVMSAIADVRSDFSNLESNFERILNKTDVEEIESLLEDDQIRMKFYNNLCEFGKKLSIILFSNSAYEKLNSTSPGEIKKYKDKFVFYSKIRASVKKRYADILDFGEYEKEMTNLLNQHMSVAGLDIITKLVNIMNKTELEKQIEELANSKAKASAIVHNLSQNISVKRDSNPAYYDSFSKRINEVLKMYRDKVINDAEYLKKMKEILDDFRDGNSGLKFPELIKHNVHAQAYYGIITPLINPDGKLGNELVAFVAQKIDAIIAIHSKVDWSENKEVHNKIEQDIDDLFFGLEVSGKLKLNFETIDKIIDNVKIVAIQRRHF